MKERVTPIEVYLAQGSEESKVVLPFGDWPLKGRLLVGLAALIGAQTVFKKPTIIYERKARH